MIYALIIFMTVLVFAYAAAWVLLPALRHHLEQPKQTLLDNNALIDKKYFGRDS